MASKSYGTTWWGREWLAALTKIDNANRIPRGKTYANTGKVLDLSIDGGKVTARVKGHYASFYKIVLTVPQVSSADTARLMDRLMKCPTVIASLTNKVLDPQILTMARELGIRIFPTQWRDLGMKCSCPDYAVPCKHIAAVIYMLSIEIDRDPFVLFRMRGIDLLAELKKRSIDLDRTEQICIPSWSEIVAVGEPYHGDDSSENTEEPGDEISPYSLQSADDDAFLPEHRDCETDRLLLEQLDRLCFENVPELFNELLQLLADNPAGYANGGFKSKYEKMLTAAAKKAKSFFKKTAQDPLSSMQLLRETAFSDFPGTRGCNHAFSAAGFTVAHYAPKTALKKWGTVRRSYEGFITGKRTRAESRSQPGAVIALTGCGILADHAVTDPVSLLDGTLTAEQISRLTVQQEICYRLFFMALRLVAAGSVVPQIICFEPECGLEIKQTRLIKDVSGSAVACRWIPAVLSPQIRSLCISTGHVLNRLSRPFVAVEGIEEPSDFTAGLTALGYFISDFIQSVYLASTDFGSGDPDFVHTVLFDTPGASVACVGLSPEFSSLQQWLGSFHMIDGSCIPQFQLTEHEGDGTDDLKIGFSMNLKLPQQSDSFVPLSSVLSDPSSGSYFDCLRLLGRLSGYCPALRELIDGGVDRVMLSLEDLRELLFSSLPLLKIIGCGIVLPKALKKILKPSVKMKISSSVPSGSISFMSLSRMFSYSWIYTVDDLEITGDEFDRLLENAGKLVRFHGRYVYFTSEEVKGLLKQKKMCEKKASATALIQAAITRCFSGLDVIVDDSAEAVLEQMFSRKDIPVPDTITAELRPYQVAGFSWMYSNARLGIGSVIADDMGLGKTLQVITVLESLRCAGELDQARALVVVPKTLLINWQKEIARFAPQLVCGVVYGTGAQLPQGGHVVITTYGKLRSASELFSSMKIRMLVIDEAQNIKNVATATRKAVCSIKASGYIAMSGTPVENRLLEYWSIMDFVNPGLLGTAAAFTRDYAVPIEHDKDSRVLEQFRRLTGPFIMRRMKTDKSIISDLPEKIVTQQYCDLTVKQKMLYEAVLNNALGELENSSGEQQVSSMKRRGLILSMITSLKQICNAPHCYDESVPADADTSGKAQTLLELLSELTAAGRKTIVFTQYTATGELIASWLRDNMNIEADFLHGALSLSQREQMVEKFQSDRSRPVLILSLKAAGTGLNITAASAVIHYDLWWNPAVENQATDRAFRIGQRNNVNVYRFVCEGTFEERIDEMIRAKQELADLTVEAGEKWLSEMSNSEIRELFTLSRNIGDSED